MRSWLRAGDDPELARLRAEIADREVQQTLSTGTLQAAQRELAAAQAWVQVVEEAGRKRFDIVHAPESDRYAKAEGVLDKRIEIEHRAEAIMAEEVERSRQADIQELREIIEAAPLSAEGDEARLVLQEQSPAAQERFDALSRAYPQEAEELIQAKVIEWQYEIGHDYEQGYEID